jgi:hypothetical protein
MQLFSGTSVLFISGNTFGYIIILYNFTTTSVKHICIIGQEQE